MDQGRNAGHVVVVAASLGGLQALQAIVSTLPADFPASMFIVMHIGTQANCPRCSHQAAACRSSMASTVQPSPQGLFILLRQIGTCFLLRQHWPVERAEGKLYASRR
ncbi:3-deoxy-D-manno-octulosonic-acid transferase [Paraburkholderia strydomiana]|nr:chemotaxis protein CheB [Paraburkholderia strydomiana]MDR7008958.1 3-deoxy-D-manno-octulosonic-acid transferase [Paraburkholderia strydomiana]